MLVEMGKYLVSPSLLRFSVLAFLIFKYSFLFLYLAALCLSCGMQALRSSLQHQVPSSLTKDQTWAPCTGSWESSTGSPGKSLAFLSF